MTEKFDPRGPALRRNRRSARLVAGSVALLSASLLAAPLLFANGGTLRLSNVPIGEYRVSVFTDPTPVRPDTLDVSVLVLREGVDGVAEGVEVWVRSRSSLHEAPPLEVRATREQADDPRYYAAKFSLGHEGPWEIEVEVRGEAGHGSASFQVTARERGVLSHPLTVILLALLPLAAAALWLFRAEGTKPTKANGPQEAPGDRSRN